MLQKKRWFLYIFWLDFFFLSEPWRDAGLNGRKEAERTCSCCCMIFMLCLCRKFCSCERTLSNCRSRLLRSTDAIDSSLAAVSLKDGQDKNLWRRRLSRLEPAEMTESDLFMRWTLWFFFSLAPVLRYIIERAELTLQPTTEMPWFHYKGALMSSILIYSQFTLQERWIHLALLFWPLYF